MGYGSDLSGGDLVYLAADSNIWYTNLGYSNKTTLEYNIDWEPLSTTNTPTHLGYEMALGHTLDVAGKRFALSKYARGGTAIAEWTSNGWFVEAAARHTAQIAALAAATGENVYPAALIWCQGEDERSNTVSTWAAQLAAGVATIRQIVGRIQLPVIVVQTQDYDGSTDTGIRAAEAAFVAADAHASLVDTSAYPYANPPHWNATQYCRIGELCKTALNLVL
jgi:hypothetical protein